MRNVFQQGLLWVISIGCHHLTDQLSPFFPLTRVDLLEEFEVNNIKSLHMKADRRPSVPCIDPGEYIREGIED